MSMVMNLAHRGASQYAPENTLAAFYKGLEQGANGIETDLRISSDGVIFLLHDDKLDRTTNGTGSHAGYTWRELQELDAGGWFSPSYAGERLISLETFLHLFGRKPIRLVLELKSAGIEKQVLEAVHKHDLMDKVTMTSFHFDMLKEVRRLDGRAHIGYLIRTWQPELLEQLRDLGVQQLCPSAESVTQEYVHMLKQAGLQVRAWGVKDGASMNHCLQSGVDGMTINFPDKLQAAVSRQHESF
jgi:glycerophosphoryl diester phosphodiesterase